MAETVDQSVIEVVRKFVEELRRNRFRISEVRLFGSYANGRARPESDIDLAVISEDFTGDRFGDRRKIVPLRRKIDNRIEPVPFRPDDFNNGGMLAEEIKRTGIVVFRSDQ
jgi:predicted nucleotidyltransferase